MTAEERAGELRRKYEASTGRDGLGGLGAMALIAIRAAVNDALEQAALLHDGIDPACSCEPQGCGAIGAIVAYRDAIRALKEPTP